MSLNTTLDTMSHTVHTLATKVTRLSSPARHVEMSDLDSNSYMLITMTLRDSMHRGLENIGTT